LSLELQFRHPSSLWHGSTSQIQMITVLFAVLMCACGTEASCEALWMSNHSSAYGSSAGLSEPVNAATSLAYSIFGGVGLNVQGHAASYYIVMQLFVMNGVGSFTHHLLYSNADWAYQLDHICVIAIAGISLHYMASSLLLLWLRERSTWSVHNGCVALLTAMHFGTSLLHGLISMLSR